MDIRLLKYYVAIAQAGSITRAADLLHITQPTLSRQMKVLEDTLGTTLLNRDHKQLSLTEEGMLFLQRAKEIIALEERTIRELKEQKGQLAGTLSIGCVESYASALLAELLGEFRRKNPAVRFEIYSADSSDIKEKLDSGRLDIGLLLEPVEVAKYDFFHLPSKETWGVVLPKEHPLAAKESVTTEDIQDLPLTVPRRTIVMDEISSWLGIPVDRLNVVSSHNLLSNALLMAKEGLSCIICVEGAFTMRPDELMVFRPFYPLRQSGHVLARRKNHILSRTAMSFLSFVQEYLAAKADNDADRGRVE
ncbi:MAG: LysR family transcriptional regulator [Selenomonadaceae bacterium]|nr:LysR family transcriptional regulator [Selenomonadaceae bacterium]